MTCVNESLKFPGWRLDKTDTQQSIETKITAKGEELGTRSRSHPLLGNTLDLWEVTNQDEIMCKDCCGSAKQHD